MPYGLFSPPTESSAIGQHWKLEIRYVRALWDLIQDLPKSVGDLIVFYVLWIKSLVCAGL